MQKPVESTDDKVRAHGIGVVIGDDRDEAMSRFVEWDKRATLEAHEQEVSDLKSHASDLGDEIRRKKKIIDRLWLAVFGMALVVAYFAVRDLGCK